MAISADVEEFVEKHIKLMISQTETYLPFIRVVFHTLITLQTE